MNTANIQTKSGAQQDTQTFFGHTKTKSLDTQGQISLNQNVPMICKTELDTKHFL
jgi:hypothetical protein